MKRRKKIKYIHEGQYVAETEVELMEDETGWPPYLSVEDAYKLDDVRDALRNGDLKSATKYGSIYELRTVAHQYNSIPTMLHPDRCLAATGGKMNMHNPPHPVEIIR